MGELTDPAGKAARAISEMTETLELGCACMCTARYETPTKSVIAIKPIARSVRAAFLPGGGRNALTPFELASTPVSAEAPEAKACSRTKMPTAPAPAAIGSGACTVGHSPVAQRPTPVPTITNIAATKAYVGRAKSTPDSRTPRRLTIVMIAMKARERVTSCPASDGAADVRASTPAATETATVRM